MVRRIAGFVFLWAGVMGMVLGWIGCQPLTPTKPSPPQANLPDANRLHAGDQISVVFSGVEKAPERLDGRINDNGRITLPYIGLVKAEGKLVSELQQEIYTNYVPRFYTSNLTVNVTSENRSYSVEGEVRMPGRQVYAGRTTVLSAIASVQGFTDFAAKNRVLIIRANGQTAKVNCKKALKNPALDLEIYAGDRIHVYRRLW